MEHRAVSEMIEDLKRAGWVIGATGFVQCGSRRTWTISGVNGENRIAVEGPTELDAWRAAYEQARLLGML